MHVVVEAEVNDQLAFDPYAKATVERVLAASKLHQIWLGASYPKICRTEALN
jgi:hypothetical protein